MKLSNLDAVTELAKKLARLRNDHDAVSALGDEITISVNASSYYGESAADVVVPKHVVLGILNNQISEVFLKLNELGVEFDT